MKVPFKKTDHLLKFIFGAALILSMVYVVVDGVLSAIEFFIALLHSLSFPNFK
ncbi:hypothetical protein IDJ77_06590 [Mucilaginibacter sp. ZT4R22]|uniref:TMhelix containing protein n=1 Tax=Mucilaginibacter pankratovii TaxID=2772110 RepID=A0ABR7WMV4_9SPHI|nr:hypothetical protein [Mucilaginibacter pankratovii]MBD1363471.1 hypothetical protein [Mucilaginibacter pankratovii]